MTVVATRSSQGTPREATIRDIIGAAVPGVNPAQVHVFLAESEKAHQETEYVGPIEVVATSARTAKIWLGRLLVICVLLAGGLIGAGVALRRLRLES